MSYTSIELYCTVIGEEVHLHYLIQVLAKLLPHPNHQQPKAVKYLNLYLPIKILIKTVH